MRVTRIILDRLRLTLAWLAAHTGRAGGDCGQQRELAARERLLANFADAIYAKAGAAKGMLGTAQLVAQQ